MAYWKLGIARDTRLRCGSLGLAVIAVLIGTGWLQATTALAAPSGPPLDNTTLSGLPLNFEPNKGQESSKDVEYVAHGKSFAIALTQDGAVLALDGGTKSSAAAGRGGPAELIHLRLLGKHPSQHPSAEMPLPGKVNYFIGNDPGRWRSGISTFGRVRYPAVYPGVDLVYYGNQGHLEYDFDVAPGADPRAIGVRFEGADQVRLDVRGNLAIDVHGRQVAFERPVAYQWDGERRVAVKANYRLAGKAVRFELGAYDHRKALVIDPVLSYFSYLGGSGNDSAGDTQATSINVQGGPNPLGIDPKGNVYVVGTTGSLDFPTKDPFAAAPAKVNCGNCTWAFVTSVSPDGATLNYSTYLGGSLGSDTAASVAVDASGNAYLVGSTYSNDFPVTHGAFQTVCGPTWNDPTGTEEPGCNYFGPGSAFVAKLNASGELVASTFLGAGAGPTGPSTIGTAIAIDSADRVYVVGTTSPGQTHGNTGGSAQQVAFPVTANALLSPPPYTTANDDITLQPQDAFVSVFNSSLTTLLYSTLYGDTQVYNPNVNQETKITNGFAVAVDATGNFYVGGITQDGYLPTTKGSLQPSISSCGALDSYGNLAGLQGPACNFVAKFSPVTTPSGAPANPSLVYGTYFGGLIPTDAAQPLSGIAATAAGDLYVLGTTASYPGFPTTAGSYQRTCTGGNCASAFISELNATGTTLLASTLYGGRLSGINSAAIDEVVATSAIVLDKSDNVYITGIAASLLEQVDPITHIGNRYDAPLTPFVAKFDSTLSALSFATVLNATPYPEATGYVHAGGGLAVDAAGDIFVAGTSTGGVYVGTTETTAGVFQPNFGGGIGGYPTDAFIAKIAQVDAVPTSTHLTSSAPTATYGAALTFTATVDLTKGTTTPKGEVSFRNGNADLGNANLNGSGVASLTTRTLPVGSPSITAVYAGNETDGASTSSAVRVSITQASTTTSLSADPTTASAGKAILLTAKVKPTVGTAVPQGEVEFLNGTTRLGDAQLNTAGVATLTVSTLAVGVHSLSAVYAATKDDASSTSNVVKLTIN